MKNFYKILIPIIMIFSSNLLHCQYSLWTWGSNLNGQLGNERAENAPTPILINDDGDWERVYSYYAIKKDGTLWTWGNGKAVHLFDDSKWEKVITVTDNPYRAVYGIKQDGSLWSWGMWNFGWVIAEDSTISKPSGKIIDEPILIDSTHKWKEVEIDNNFLLAIDELGELYTWGRYWPIMGIGELDEPEKNIIDRITKVGDSNDWTEVSVSSFEYRTFGVKEDGSIWFWGSDQNKLIDTINKLYFTPTKLGDYDCKNIRTNTVGTLFTNSKGEVYSIGEFNSVTTTKPNRLTYGNDNIEFIDTDRGCFALKLIDFCILLGNNDGLKFGPEYKDSYYSFFVAPYFESMKGFKGIAQTGNGFIFIDSSNNLRAWGSNSNGELGNGISSKYSEPFQLLPSRTFKDASCGENYSIAIDEYGMMWIWGTGPDRNIYGDKPVLANYDVDWDRVFTFKNSNFATKKDGTLWAWGENEYGQLGVGHNNPVLTPTKVEEYGPWRLIHSNSSYESAHTLALKEDGSLWVWGTGGKTLGIGVDTVTQIYKPTKVNSDTDWTDIGCGDGFSVALKKDSTYWCWGGNSNGVFGDYEDREYNVPTKESPRWSGRIVQIEASDEAVIAINTVGEVHIFAPSMCGSTDSFYDDPSSMFLYSNYRGFNAIITEEQELFVGTSSHYNGIDYLKLINTALRKATDDKDWVKATIGGQHILALKGEKISNVKQTKKLVNADIYPNPSISNINIDFDSFYNSITIFIYDLSGKLILEKKSNNTDRVNINHNLPSGAYLLQCRDSNSIIVDQVFVVE
ncbi:MAG: T9SS type A sorting domain-containing protein [Chlorobiota bacterium]